MPEVSVLIDYHTLVEGDHSASTCETADGQPLPVETIRRLCCEGDIVPIVLGGHGEILDVGHQRRLATRAQRRALRALYRSCAHPQCTVAFDACRIHHVIWWEHHGPTNLANLLPLCETHHHLVHEGGWTLELHPDRRTVWSTPDGTIHYDAITTDRRPHAETVTESDQPRPHPPRRRARRTGTRHRPSDPAHAELQLTLTDLTGRAPP